VAKHPAARWIGSIASAVVAGVVVVVLTTHSSPPSPGPSPLPTGSVAPTATASPPDPLDGITMTAKYIPRLYSAARADGFGALLPAGTPITKEMQQAPDCEHLHALLAKAGAVDSGGSAVELFFQNAAGLPAVITQVKAEVTHLQASTLTTRVGCSNGAGPLEPLKGIIELDATSPVVRAVSVNKVNGTVTPAGPYFVNQLAQVRPGETVVLQIQVDPGTCTCAWKIVANMLVGGHAATLTAEHGTQPFRTAPFLSTPGRDCWAFDFQARPPHLTRSSTPC
jgi:hypothetical protein